MKILVAFLLPLSTCHAFTGIHAPSHRIHMQLEASRRDFVTAGALVGLSWSLPSDATPDVDYKAVAADIAKLIKDDPDKGPTLVRLAWHVSNQTKIRECESSTSSHLSVLGHLRQDVQDWR